MASRTIYHDDALAWLKSKRDLKDCSFVTSLPDASEFSNLSLEEWKSWFVNAAKLVLSSCPDTGITIFYQSDIKREGTWIDKGYLCQKAAEQLDHHLLFHKIVCRAPAGATTFGRPSYSHLIGFSKNCSLEVAKSTVDVLPQAGAVTWTRGMGVEACKLACRIILESTNTKTIIDPFCGHGTVLSIANSMGLDAIGIELSLKRVKIAKSLNIAI